MLQPHPHPSPSLLIMSILAPASGVLQVFVTLYVVTFHVGGCFSFWFFLFFFPPTLVFCIVSLSPVSRQWFYPMVGDIMLFYHRVEPRTGCWEVSASVNPSVSPYTINPPGVGRGLGSAWCHSWWRGLILS